MYFITSSIFLSFQYFRNREPELASGALVASSRFDYLAAWVIKDFESIKECLIGAIEFEGVSRYKNSIYLGVCLKRTEEDLLMEQKTKKKKHWLVGFQLNRQIEQKVRVVCRIMLGVHISSEYVWYGKLEEAKSFIEISKKRSFPSISIVFP